MATYRGRNLRRAPNPKRKRVLGTEWPQGLAAFNRDQRRIGHPTRPKPLGTHSYMWRPRSTSGRLRSRKYANPARPRKHLA